MEERRRAVRDAALKRAAVVLALLWPCAADACVPDAAFVPAGRAESAGVVVVYRIVPASLELGRHFSVEAAVCADDAAPVLTRIDAEMPEHRHGMNYRPTLDAKGAGRYVADGFLFHMPGRWQLRFDVERPGVRTRLTSDVVVE